jgi:hypothetical protein
MGGSVGGSPARCDPSVHDFKSTFDDYELESADVAEALAWAEAERGGRTFVVYACVPRDGLGLVRLHGTDPQRALNAADPRGGW